MFRLPIVKFFSRILNRATITIVLVALQVLWLLWAFWAFTTGRVRLNGMLKALSIVIVLYLVRKDENSAYKIGWIVLIGLLLSMIPLLQWMPGLLFDGNDVEVSIFLQRALDIVIGIEFIKMLAKHSPGSSLEVLLYAIARHMVVGHESALDNLISVGAIALIFVVRKFFFVPAFGAHLPDGKPAPDLTPNQSGIPAEEFRTRLRQRIHAEALAEEEDDDEDEETEEV